ncbi:DUF4129 domain-containing protein [Agaribacterium haliotis]|uniref:DUF4129 domain-containing protein n=1 Tax=Agaribacterium haliotis TaxID=2013869 RepID=UPI000BB563BA|nr:DUF4129 domain-containing protein [Agaribacterium haliotis]
MRLDKLQAKIKKRSAWQAIDLGCAMASAMFVKLWLLWFSAAACGAAALYIVFDHNAVYTALACWWLKPLWERPLLYVVSRELFAEQVSVLQIGRHWWHIQKNEFWHWLSYRRLLPMRSFLLPIAVLEGLSGKKRQRRSELLLRRFSSAATWLSVSGLLIELCLALALATALALFVPEGSNVNWQYSLLGSDNAVALYIFALLLLAASLVAPFYVAAGFSLYIQRRVDLEAWDIELQFHQLAERAKAKQKRQAQFGSKIGCLLLLVLLSFNSELSGAEDLSSTSEQVETHEDKQYRETGGPERSDSGKLAKQQINEILGSAPFYNTETKTILGQKTEDDDELPGWLIRFAEWLDKHGGFFEALASMLKSLAQFVELTLWLAVLGLILFVLWRYRQWIKEQWQRIHSGKHNEQIDVPRELFGIVLEDKKLPDDVATQALLLWRQQQERAAFVLLLRSSLLVSVNKGCRFKDGYTERECAELVNASLKPALAQSFNQLIQHWQQLAYAHHCCSQQQFEQLCQQHRELWQGE